MVYLNGVAQNEPYAAMPNDNSSDFEDHYRPDRDDFPADIPGIQAEAIAVWAEELPQHVVNGELVVPPGMVFAMGDNREHSLDGRFLGICADGEHHGQADVRLLVLQNAGRPGK